jgi:hypothetical protein
MVSSRLRSRVERDFAPEVRVAVLGALEPIAEDPHRQDEERMQAALVLGALGDWGRFERLLALYRLDWRDLLMAGGLANGDWPAVLDRELPADPEAAG